MHGPTCIVWANLTPFSLQYPAWNTCNTTDGSPLSRCKTYGTDPYGQVSVTTRTSRSEVR